LLYSGKEAKVTAIKIEQLLKLIKVYNFGVEDWHTYFVSNENTLVHNMCALQDRGMIKAAARDLGISAKKFGDYVEAYKEDNLIPNYATLSWNKLMELGKQFKEDQQ
jgi:hypothetical protein